MIKPSFMFSDYAVLQWGREVPVWGECDSDSLTVTFLGNAVNAEVKNGKFSAMLPPMPANLSGELVFSSATQYLLRDCRQA